MRFAWFFSLLWVAWGALTALVWAILDGALGLPGPALVAAVVMICVTPIAIAVAFALALGLLRPDVWPLQPDLWIRLALSATREIVLHPRQWSNSNVAAEKRWSKWVARRK